MNPCNDKYYELLLSVLKEDNGKKLYDFLKDQDFNFTGQGYMAFYERRTSRLSMLAGKKPTELKHRSGSWAYKFQANNKKDIFSIRRQTVSDTEQ